MAGRTQPPYPLHPSIIDKLNPEYAKFYNENLLNAQVVHHQPIEVSRGSGVLLPGAGPQLPVGKIEDIAIKRKESEGPDVMVRCFTPEGEKPEGGWPVFLYFHGGGWVLGNIQTENTVASHMCARARCVVISVDYRLAPENPFPAAVHDSWESVLWILSEGATRLSLNLSKIATGGSSAGGNLAAVMTQKALDTKTPIKFLTQLLSVPVTDNTAMTSNNGTYKAYEFTPALPAEKMLWYRRHYLPNESEWGHPEASPLLWEGEWGALSRKALVVVGGLDVLREEGERFGEKLREGGVDVKTVVMEGMPHPFLAMDAVMKAGRDTITLMVDSLKEVFE